MTVQLLPALGTVHASVVPLLVVDEAVKPAGAPGTEEQDEGGGVLLPAELPLPQATI